MIEFDADPVMLSTIVIGEIGQRLDHADTPSLWVLVPSGSAVAHVLLIRELLPKLGFKVNVGYHDDGVPKVYVVADG
jgi:hypothetical protein